MFLLFISINNTSQYGGGPYHLNGLNIFDLHDYGTEPFWYMIKLFNLLFFWERIHKERETKWIQTIHTPPPPKKKLLWYTWFINILRIWNCCMVGTENLHEAIIAKQKKSLNWSHNKKDTFKSCNIMQTQLRNY